VDDQQRWDRAVEATSRMYDGLPPETRARLDLLITRIMGLKEALVERVLAAGSLSICRACAGACCRSGRYHVSALDLLAFRSCEAEPVAPDFGTAPSCPYGGPEGCRMSPPFRPMTCVVFNCDLVEALMGQEDSAALYTDETLLRDAIVRASRLTGQRLDRPLLLWCDG
jgi:hypothetical protein